MEEILTIIKLSSKKEKYNMRKDIMQSDAHLVQIKKDIISLEVFQGLSL